ncbi:MAG TPA: hypothetical protein DCQ98_15355 [Planctomycetaceae bacterium]|nr:hypothetical protein [Planctomycetaceae bacterium]
MNRQAAPSRFDRGNEPRRRIERVARSKRASDRVRSAGRSDPRVIPERDAARGAHQRDGSGRIVVDPDDQRIAVVRFVMQRHEDLRGARNLAAARRLRGDRPSRQRARTVERTGTDRQGHALTPMGIPLLRLVRDLGQRRPERWSASKPRIVERAAKRGEV